MNIVDFPGHMPPAREIIHPLESRWGACFLIPDFLSQKECEELIEAAEKEKFKSAETDYPPSYRNNERLVIDDEQLAHGLFSRLQAGIPQSIASVTDAVGAEWELEAINERVRFCRYRQGQEFNIHQDGVYYRDQNRQSKRTFLIYLTDGSEFGGGDTVFYANGPGSEEPRIIGKVKPSRGSLIIFDHTIWHAGGPVTSGVKHILRSDLIYRNASVTFENGDLPYSVGHDGYIWTMVRLASGHMASGGRDQTVRLWTPGGRLAGSLSGHTRSVLGLAQTTDGHLASVSRDSTMRLWNIEKGTCEKTIYAHDAAILSVKALHKELLATASADHLIKIWTDQGKFVKDLNGHKGWVWETTQIDHDRLASASEDATIKAWSIREGKCEQIIPVAAPLRCIQANPQRRLVAAGDIDGKVHLWSTGSSTLQTIGEFQAHTAAVRCIAFLNADVIATSGEDRRVKLWDLRTLKLLQEAEHTNFVTCVLPKGRESFLSCSYDGHIREHRIESNAAVAEMGCAS